MEHLVGLTQISTHTAISHVVSHVRPRIKTIRNNVTYIEIQGKCGLLACKATDENKVKTT